jgi:hypothetical protein
MREENGRAAGYSPEAGPEEPEGADRENGANPAAAPPPRVLDRREAERLFGSGEVEWSGLERKGGVLTIRLVLRSGDTLSLRYDPVNREKRFEAWPSPACFAGT